MKVIVLVFIFLVVLNIVYSSEITKHEIFEKFMGGSSKELFKVYHHIYEKHNNYQLNTEESVRRYKIFKSNLDYIKQENAKNQSFKLGLTVFADMTTEEYRNQILMKPFAFQEVVEKLQANSQPQTFLEGTTVGYTPGTVKVNWMKNFGPVRDQQSCGSCWAFANAGVLEGNYNIQFGESLVLSTQQLVDCDTGNSGCQGGWPSASMDYIVKNGITLDSKYPYASGKTNTRGTCTYKNDGFKLLAKYEFCGFNNCTFDKWLELLKRGPVEIGVDAGSAAWQLYKSGVMAPTCTGANHAVVAVGIDSDSVGDYLIIRNSWGTGWGESGYFKLRVNLKDNTCFATQLGWLPIVQKVSPTPGPTPPTPGPTPPTPGPTPPPTPGPIPAPTCPVIYADCPYSGNSVQSCSSIKNLATVEFANKLSSIKIGVTSTSKKTVQLFSSENCTGKSVLINKDVDCMEWSNNTEFKKFNDRANSMAVFDSLPSANCIWVFDQCCFLGSRQEICMDVDDFGKVNFNDRIASIQFGSGVKNVIVFVDPKYDGLSYGFGNNHGCMDQVDTKVFVNSVSSLRIIK